MRRVLVIGATGHVGREVVLQLLARGEQVCAMARNPESAALPPGVEVVRGDLTIPESLDACLDGVDAVFLVWLAPAGAVSPALERMVKPAPRIVFLSAPYKTQHPMFQKPQPNALSATQAEIEGHIERSGCEWTFLRPGMFAVNSVGWWAPQILAGDVVRWPYLSAETAPTDERDIAAVAVHALCDSGHAGAEYVLTGPGSLSHRQQIEIIGEVLGRRLRVEEMTPEDARRELSAFPEFILNLLMKAWEGATGQPALLTSTVADVTGAPARSFRDWVRDHAAAFRR